MSRIAHEVSRRMTPEYAKERAREMARDRAVQAKDRAVESNWFFPVLGAAVGAFAGKALLSRAQDRRDRWASDDEYWSARPYRYGAAHAYGTDYGYSRAYDDQPVGYGSRRYESKDTEWTETGEGSPGLKDRASELSGRASERASEMKDRASEKLDDVRGRASEKAGEVRQRLDHFREQMPDRERIRASTHEDTALWALGAAALGALVGFALPVSERERQMLEPAREKVREAAREAKDRALEKGSEAMDRVSERIGDPGGQEEQHAADDDEPSIIVTTSPPPVGPTGIH